MPNDPSLPSLLAFLAVAAFAALGPLLAWWRWAEGRLPAAAGWLVLWLVATGLPSAMGFFHEGNLVPWLPLFLTFFLSIATGIALSNIGRRLASSVPLVALVAYQGFRLPLELVLHVWVDAGVVPEQMTWTGANIDVWSGVAAVVAVPWVLRWPRLAWIPSVVGFVLLLNVVRTVVQSMPTPLQRYDEPVLLALSFPEVWIASVCVAGAWMAHLVTFRALLQPPARP